MNFTKVAKYLSASKFKLNQKVYIKKGLQWRGKEFKEPLIIVDIKIEL